MAQSRTYDIILYGATGYTGEITAEYLAANYRGNEKWAISGRSKSKLDELKAKLMLLNKDCVSIGVIPCDATKSEEIKFLASQTRVLINCVGPYRIYGDQVVAACVEAGTDYTDVTGEPPFVMETIAKYHNISAEKQIYILPACGVGSLIPDVCVQLLKDEYTKEGTRAVKAQGYAKYNGRYAKTFSNGTWQTFVNSMSKKNSRGSSGASKESRGSKKPKFKRRGFHYYAQTASWGFPFVEGADVHIVKRTNELTMHDDEFFYEQFIAIPLIPPLWLISIMFTILFMMLFSKIAYVKNMLLKRNFQDGGPSKAQRQTSSFDFYAHGIDEVGNRKVVHCHAPGPYDTSGICAAEVALALVHDRKQLKPIFGVTTPGAVMNSQMLRRLPASGITLEVDSSAKHLHDI